MRFYLKSRNGEYDAIAYYDENNKNFIVLKGSKVSKRISQSPKFRGSKSIEKGRKEHVVGQNVKNDVIFKSPSTAANFVTGSSTNGRKAWKDTDGRSFKEVYGGD